MIDKKLLQQLGWSEELIEETFDISKALAAQEKSIEVLPEEGTMHAYSISSSDSLIISIENRDSNSIQF